MSMPLAQLIYKTAGAKSEQEVIDRFGLESGSRCGEKEQCM